LVSIQRHCFTQFCSPANPRLAPFPVQFAISYSSQSYYTSQHSIKAHCKYQKGSSHNNDVTIFSKGMEESRTATRRSSRRVAAAAAAARRSDDDTDSVASSTRSESSSITSPTATGSTTRRRHSLSLHLLAELAEDLELYGGIEKHAGRQKTLHRLLNHLVSTDEEKKDLYKPATDPIRRKIQTQVLRWQNNRTKYEEILTKNNILKASRRDVILQLPALTESEAEEEKQEEVRLREYSQIPENISTFSNQEELLLTALEEENEEEENNMVPSPIRDSAGTRLLSKCPPNTSK